MCNAKKDILSALFELQDTEYRKFHTKLIPNVPAETVIGIRLPRLRLLAKDIFRHVDGYTPSVDDFLAALPHYYYEENMLHALLIEQLDDYGETVAALNKFLPFVDNWAVCDSLRPKIFKKHLDELDVQAIKWMYSEHTYMIRFGIEALMTYYLDGHFDARHPQFVSEIRSDEYYVRMMVAWYFATALAKQYDAVLPYIEQNRFDVCTHNKTIQKAVESFRITAEQKAYLKTLKLQPSKGE